MKNTSEPKSGNEHFFIGDRKLEYQLKDFWSWGFSGLLTNNLRGILAEYIVSTALGGQGQGRTERDAYDIVTANGIKIEVKSAAYIQNRKQKDYSKITFSIRPTRGYDIQTGKYATEYVRQSDYYVFCLLSHKDHATINPLDLNQREFFVVTTKVLNQEYTIQKTISLQKLLHIAKPLCYNQLSLDIFI